MSSAKLGVRSLRPAMTFGRSISSTSYRMFAHKDRASANTARMMGSITGQIPEGSPDAEMGVGELEGAKFKVEPLRRTGEDGNTMRARLLYQSRKRGTLESDLLMSTFAEAHLRQMSMAQMRQFDIFLDENDWDIYYWATQEPGPASQETAEGAARNVAGKETGSPDAGKQTAPQLETDAWRQGSPRSGEWAQTVGTFKPAYRPVPARWKNSEILAMLRKHVLSRSAGGVQEGEAKLAGEGSNQSVQRTGGGGMAFMPPVFATDRAENS